MSPAAVRVGLVGYGRGGRYFHAPLIEQAPECVLAGVVTKSPERRGELARDYPGVATLASLAEMASAGIDVVVVSTPLETHAALVGMAIELGLPVVSDKPFASDAEEARRLVEAAERAGNLVSVYQNRRFDADFLTVRKVVESGVLGGVVTFESRMEQYPPETGVPTTGGGVLRDLGSHLVDQALLLFGPVQAVYAEANALSGDGLLDDEFFAVLRHRSGVSSHLWGSFALQGAPGPRFRVVATDATYAAEGDDGQAERLLAGRTPATEGETFGTVPEERWGLVYRGGVGTPVPAERGRWSDFYTGLAAAVRGEAPVPVNPWDAVAALEVLDAARESAAVGRSVLLTEKE